MRDMHHLILRCDCKFKYLIEQYFEQGMHRKDHPVSEYVLMPEWTRLRYALDYGLYPEEARKTENKVSFKRLLRDSGYNTAGEVGWLQVDKEHHIPVVEPPSGNPKKLDEALSEFGCVFAKPSDGLQGLGCGKIERGGDDFPYLLNGKQATEQDIVSFINAQPTIGRADTPEPVAKRLLVEPLLINHESLRCFHPSSLNTMRVLTMRTPGGGVEVNRAIMRFGTGGRCTDNLHAQGIAIPVNLRTGEMVEWGHVQKLSAPPYRQHPDSGLTFKGVPIPYWQESLELVLEVRRQICPHLFNVGFDVVITPTGPLLLEANVHSGFFQRAGAGGIRPIMNTWLKPLAEEFRKGNPIPY